MQTKVCTVCKETKSVSEFHVRLDSYASGCKECYKKKRQAKLANKRKLEKQYVGHLADVEEDMSGYEIDSPEEGARELLRAVLRQGALDSIGHIANKSPRQQRIIRNDAAEFMFGGIAGGLMAFLDIGLEGSYPKFKEAWENMGEDEEWADVFETVIDQELPGPSFTRLCN